MCPAVSGLKFCEIMSPVGKRFVNCGTGRWRKLERNEDGIRQEGD
jgi:hypothetical protein